jgi:hypothetical protein
MWQVGDSFPLVRTVGFVPYEFEIKEMEVWRFSRDPRISLSLSGFCSPCGRFGSLSQPLRLDAEYNQLATQGKKLEDSDDANNLGPLSRLTARFDSISLGFRVLIAICGFLGVFWGGLHFDDKRHLFCATLWTGSVLLGGLSLTFGLAPQPWRFPL